MRRFIDRSFIQLGRSRHNPNADAFELQCCSRDARWAYLRDTSRSFLLFGLLFAAANASAQELLIRNATVHTATAQGTLKGADVLVSGGTIRAVGTGLAGARRRAGDRRARAAR